MSPRDTFDFSGLGVRLHGVPHDVGPSLRDEWRPYLASVEGPFLDLSIAEGAVAIPERGTMGAQLDATFSPGAARFSAEEGEVEVEATGRGRVVLGRGETGRRFFGLMSLVAAAFAWTLSRERGVALHAAGIVLDGRAFLLVGPSGAGKTTWAEAGRAAGALVLSDDLVVVETGVRPVALGVPFRVRPHAPPPPGRWPVAAVLLARHGTEPALRAVSGLAARALLAANVLYVEPGFRADLETGGPLRSVAGLPARELAFPPDASFVPLLRAFVP